MSRELNAFEFVEETRNSTRVLYIDNLAIWLESTDFSPNDECEENTLNLDPIEQPFSLQSSSQVSEEILREIEEFVVFYVIRLKLALIIKTIL